MKYINIIVLLMHVCAIKTFLCEQLSTFSFNKIQTKSPSLVSNTLDVVNTLDSTLYSRQLFVYGESAQRLLKASHIAVLGSNSVAHEVVKNLALAGLGRLTVQLKQSRHISNQRLINGYESLAEYARELNPHVHVHYCICCVYYFAINCFTLGFGDTSSQI